MHSTTPPYDIAKLTDAYMANSDLDFELQVYHYLKTQNLEPNHGGRYLDPMTQKWREYDIRVPFPQCFAGLEFFLHIAAVIECKNISAQCPLVIGVRELEQHREGVRYVNIEYGPKGPFFGSSHLVHLERLGRIVDLFGGPFIGTIGVEVVQVVYGKLATGTPRPERSALYDKWSQAVSHAVIAYQQICEDLYSIAGEFSADVWCPPILVVPDDRLFIAQHDKNGTHLAPADGVLFKSDAEFTIPQIPFLRPRISNTFIFTFTGLQRFVSLFSHP